MGGGSWSSDDYKTASSLRASTGKSTFGHDTDVKTGKAKGVHTTLDPATVAGPSSPLAGMCVREARDSKEHPESLPIVMIFDVTGSMGGIPKILQDKLPKLMETIIDKAGVPHPQILVGAVGDSTTDRYPLQVGQFESDNRVDEHLRNLILEGGGGGQIMESYALAYRFGAYHTATDSWEKRGKKGYFFTMGDEAYWPTVTKEDVKKLFGVEAEADETMEDLLAKTQEKWEVYHLFSNDSGYKNDKEIHRRWKALLGERFVIVEDSSMVCEVIAGLILALETAKDMNAVIKDLGLKGAAAKVVTTALSQVTESSLPAHVATGSVPVAKKKSGVTRV